MVSTIKYLFSGEIALNHPCVFLNFWLDISIPIQKELRHLQCLPYTTPSHPAGVEKGLLHSFLNKFDNLYLGNSLPFKHPYYGRFFERYDSWERKKKDRWANTFLAPIRTVSGKWNQKPVLQRYVVCHRITKTPPTLQIWTNLYRYLNYKNV